MMVEERMDMEVQEETWKVTLHIKKYKLEKNINLIKKELIEKWEQKGLNHHETIEVSQKLDKEIVKYQKLILLGKK